MSRTATVLVSASVLAALLSAASAQTQWDLPTNYGASAFHTRNIVQFAADVETATGGSVKIAVIRAAK
jgi:TRAP-type C4-dicarboxylate transport system substrate-binding protein